MPPELVSQWPHLDERSQSLDQFGIATLYSVADFSKNPVVVPDPFALFERCWVERHWLCGLETLVHKSPPFQVL